MAKLTVGKVIADEMRMHGSTPAAYAAVWGIEPAKLEAILAGKADLDLFTASKLDLAFKTSPGFWLRLDQHIRGQR
jgi:plasmid maintenance system antidote protein VapI